MHAPTLMIKCRRIYVHTYLHIYIRQIHIQVHLKFIAFPHVVAQFVATATNIISKCYQSEALGNEEAESSGKSSWKNCRRFVMNLCEISCFHCATCSAQLSSAVCYLAYLYVHIHTYIYYPFYAYTFV